LKRQLTQNAAHELKTPVASIQGYLETIITNPNITEEQKKIFLERCYAQSQRLTSLLHDISTLNRLDDAPDVRNFQDVDVSAIMQSIEREVGLQLQENGMTIVDNLPEKLIKRGNQSLIYSIFRNLVDNSIAYAGKGTTIDVSYDGSHFTFMDNGVGVGEEHLTRIFERFYRVDKGRSRKLGGTGLGLAIVKNAVLLHGGTISASINEPHGLRFDFTL
jgi:signal transduction histidine kinase